MNATTQRTFRPGAIQTSIAWNHAKRPPPGPWRTSGKADLVEIGVWESGDDLAETAMREHLNRVREQIMARMVPGSRSN
jgi:hypothetical protein